MQVLSQKFEGFIHICPTCNAVLSYVPTDIYEGKYIYCPICKTKASAAVDLNYDGVKEKK